MTVSNKNERYDRHKLIEWFSQDKLKKSHITLDECLEEHILQFTISVNEKNFIYNVIINTIPKWNS